MNETLAFYVYRAASLVRGEDTFKYLAEFEISQWQDRFALAEFQDRKLKELLEYARTHIARYRPLQGAELDDFPLLEKKTLKTEPGILINGNLASRATVKSTAGSTGEPVKVLKDSEAMSREQAITMRGYRWAGVNPGARQGRFWGTPLRGRERLLTRLKDACLNKTRFSAFQYDEEVLERYYRTFLDRKPTYLYGFASMIQNFANYLRATGKAREYPFLKAVVTTSEILSDKMRQDIQEALGVRVFNEYGCAELGTIAHECGHGSLHIGAENLVVEVMTEGGKLQHYGEGRIVVTELHNRVQPLIRYDLGDIGIVSASACACGRVLPVIKDIHGRAYDTILGPERKRYSPAFFSYVIKETQKGGERVSQYQVIQEDRKLTFNIVKGPDFDAGVEQSILDVLGREFGNYFLCEFNYVPAIAREKSGKSRVVKRIRPLDEVVLDFGKAPRKVPAES